MEEQYDSFYRSTRRDLLLQTFALTGDLTAARVAVRDAYVGAWQHWRKVSRLDDPLEWIRPRAWQLAQRRHTGRIWHRNKGLGERHRRVLHALSELPVAHRRVLLLVRVAGLEPSDAARELGVTRETAERELRLATAAYAGALDLPPRTSRARARPGRRARLRRPAPRTDRAPLGRKRRQTHTLVGAAAAAVVALASGAFAYEPDATSADSVRRVKPSADGVVYLDGNSLGALPRGVAERVTVTLEHEWGTGLISAWNDGPYADGWVGLARRVGVRIAPLVGATAPTCTSATRRP